MRKLFTALLVLACIAMLIMTSLPDSGKATENTSQSFSIEASTTPLTVSSMPTEEEKPEQTKPFFPNEEAFLDYLEKTQTDAGFTAVAYEDFYKTGLGHLHTTYPVEGLYYANHVFYRIDEVNPEHFFLTQILYNFELKLAIISEKEIHITDHEAVVVSNYSPISTENAFSFWANYVFDYLFYLNEAEYPHPSYIIRNTLYCADDLGEKHCNALVEGFLRGMEFDADWNPVEKIYPSAYWQQPDPTRTENNGEYEYEVYPDNTVRITRYLGSDSHLNIPSELEGMPVASIRSLWFDVNMEYPASYAKRATVTSVTIPEGILYIEDYVFQLCTNLEEIHIASSVTYIGTCAFDSCEKLRNIYFYGAPPSFGNMFFTWSSTSQDTIRTLYYPKEYIIPWSYTLQKFVSKTPI